MSERDRRRSFGILAVLAILGLVGWGVYETTVDSPVATTGDELSEDEVLEETVEESQENYMTKTEETFDSDELYQ